MFGFLILMAKSSLAFSIGKRLVWQNKQIVRWNLNFKLSKDISGAGGVAGGVSDWYDGCDHHTAGLG